MTGDGRAYPVGAVQARAGELQAAIDAAADEATARPGCARHARAASRSARARLIGSTTAAGSTPAAIASWNRPSVASASASCCRTASPRAVVDVDDKDGPP